jgi:hypothetical protein
MEEGIRMKIEGEAAIRIRNASTRNKSSGYLPGLKSWLRARNSVHRDVEILCQKFQWCYLTESHQFK